MDNMIRLTDSEKELVMRADEMFGPYSCGSDAKRTYTIARNRKYGDIMFVMVRVQNEGGTPVPRAIGMTSAMTEESYFSSHADIITCWSSMCQIRLVTDFGKPYNKDGTMWKTKDGLYSLWHRPLNIDDCIRNSPVFRFCALPKCGVNALAWLRLYKDYPEAEYFAKMNLEYLAVPKFIERLRRDKGLVKFLARNRADIKRRFLKPTQVEYAYRHGLTVDGMFEKLAFDSERRSVKCNYDIRALNLPPNFDWDSLVKFIGKTKISTWEYARYARYCMGGGADMTDPNTAFPHNLERRLKDFDENKRRMDLKACNEKLKKVAKRLLKKMVGLDLGKYEVIVPDEADLFVREGKAMGNCIGGGCYAKSMAAGDCVCVFIRRKTAPKDVFVDVEIVKGEVKQCFGKGNKKADKGSRELAERLAEAFFPKKRKAKAKRALRRAA